jgi:hypothetical protein
VRGTRVGSEGEVFVNACEGVRRVRFSERLDEPFAPVLEVSSATCEHGREQMFGKSRHETNLSTLDRGNQDWGYPQKRGVQTE